MNLTASVMSMAVKWKHEGNPPKRRTRMACADRVVTQGDFVQLMRTSTAFRIAFSKMLLSNVKGAFLLDISITNAQETLVVEQTLANRLSFKVFGPNIPGPLRKPGPGWCKTMKDRHAKNQHLMVTPTLVNKDADTQAYLNLYTCVADRAASPTSGVSKSRAVLCWAYRFDAAVAILPRLVF